LINKEEEPSRHGDKTQVPEGPFLRQGSHEGGHDGNLQEDHQAVPEVSCLALSENPAGFV